MSLDSTPASPPWGTRLAVPVIDLDACTWCGRCEAGCPTGAIKITVAESERALEVDAAACTYCTDCEALCPVDAIECPFEIVADTRLPRPRRRAGIG